MIKRIFAVSISLLMLVSLSLNVSVFATDTKPSAIVEDFEDGVMDSEIEDLGIVATSYDFADGMGKNGGKALRIKNLTEGYCAIGFDKAYNSATDTAVISYDFKIGKLPATMPDNGKMIYLAGVRSDVNASAINMATLTDSASGERKLYFVAQTTATVFSEVNVDEWYKIVAIRKGGNYTAWIIDSKNNVAAYNRRTGAGSGVTNFCLFRSVAGSFGDGEILIDNVEFNLYDCTTYAASLINSSIKHNATDIPLNTKSLFISFDGELSSKNITLTDEDSTGVEITLSPAVDANEKTLPLNYVIVSWEGKLKSDTDYTLTVTGTDSAGKALLTEICFTTLDASVVHLWKQPSIISVAANSTDGEKTDMAFKIEDIPEYANTSFTGAVMAVVLRNDQMADFDIIADTFAADTSITKTFGFTVEAGDKLQLIQMDTQNGLTPLAWAEYSVE